MSKLESEQIPYCVCGLVAVKWTYVGGGEVLFQCEACYILSAGARKVEVDVPIDSFRLKVARRMKEVKKGWRKGE